jgi:hypothetical protein
MIFAVRKQPNLIDKRLTIKCISEIRAERAAKTAVETAVD